METPLHYVGRSFFLELQVAVMCERRSDAALAILHTLLTLEIIDCDAYNFWVR